MSAAVSIMIKALQKEGPSTVVLPLTETGQRILERARPIVFSEGINCLTMDRLAEELGISKKTIYQHFESKEAIVCTIVEQIAGGLQQRVQNMLDRPQLNCTEKLCALIEAVGENMGRINPTVLRDLQSNAPKAYAQMEAIRRRNVPKFFGRILRDGIAEGVIRSDLDPAFVTEFWLQALRGLLDPATMERTNLSVLATLKAGVALFFRGLLTPSGREQFLEHQKHCNEHGHDSGKH